MSKSLPTSASLEQLKKQAKDLLSSFHANDLSAVSRFKQHFPRLKNPTAPRLSDAQLVVAREYGFASWPKLKAHVEAATGPSTAKGQAMRTSGLVGIWKLENSAGKEPVEHGINLSLIKFKADGTFIDATESTNVFGILPKNVMRLKGSWRLEDNILERTFPEGTFEKGTSPEYTHKTLIAVNNDKLEIAAHQYDRRGNKNFVGIFVYKRVTIP